LNELLVDQSADQIERRLGRFDPSIAEGALGRRLAERVVRVLREYDAAAIEELFSDGLLNVMEAPEFANTEKLRRVWSALENRGYLATLFGTVAGAGPGRIHVFIGGENTPAEMVDVSLVLAPYGQPGRAMGVVGVLGPTRMSYPQAIGTVRFVSGLMDELVDHLYA
jgi:heat-inducible transcriptional repressor